jgi:uncharacterized protein YjbJ (UPF0337 family)
MNKDKIMGATDQAKGSVKEVVGKAIGDQKMQAEGKINKLTGKVESAVGGAKDTLRDTVNKATK